MSTRDRLLDAAQAQFASRGYHAVTIVAVADAVGVRGPAVYKHFANKEVLYTAVLERLFEPFAASISEVAGGGVEAGLAHIVEHHIARPDVSRLIQHATLVGGRPLELLVEQWYVPFFRRVRTGLADSGASISDVELMAFHSMLLGYMTLAPLHRRIFDSDPLADDAIASLVALNRRLAAAIGAAATEAAD